MNLLLETVLWLLMIFLNPISFLNEISSFFLVFIFLANIGVFKKSNNKSSRMKENLLTMQHFAIKFGIHSLTQSGIDYIIIVACKTNTFGILLF
jgi:hypothetical protein